MHIHSLLAAALVVGLPSALATSGAAKTHVAATTAANANNTAASAANAKSTAASASKPAAGKYLVLSCNDGDTCRVRGADSIQLKVRLIGIDAPEFSHEKRKGKRKRGEHGKKSPTSNAQPFAEESKEHLNDLVAGKEVTLKAYGADAYNRNLAEMMLGDVNVNLDMVRSGMAEVYRGRKSPGFDVKAYEDAEKSAQGKKRGIWSQTDYESPYDWRKRERKR